MKRQPDLTRIAALDPETRLTRKDAAKLLNCSAATIAARNHAGLLPYFPTNPVTVRAADLHRCAHMLANGIRKDLHLGMRIKKEDMPPYSRLDGVLALDRGHPSTVAKNVVRLTGSLWKKYRSI